MKILIDTKRDSISELRSAINLLKHIIGLKLNQSNTNNKNREYSDDGKSDEKNYDITEGSMDNFSAMFGKGESDTEAGIKDEKNKEEYDNVNVEFY